MAKRPSSSVVRSNVIAFPRSGDIDEMHPIDLLVTGLSVRIPELAEELKKETGARYVETLSALHACCDSLLKIIALNSDVRT